MGRASQEIGEAFENFIDVQHETAGLRGALAHVVHNMPPSKFVHGRLMYDKKGVADYTGCLHGNGMVLAAEAKSVAPGERLARSRIESKQAEHLDAVTNAGGLALLLVEFRVEGTIAHHRYAIPWQEVPWKVLRTAESLAETDIPAECLVQFGVDYLARYHNGSANRYRVGELKNRRRTYSTE